MYRVTTDHQVLEQVAALPSEALASYAELLVVLCRDAVGRELRGMAYRAGLPV